MTRISIAILSIFLLISCDEHTILKDNYDIPDAKWLIKDTPTFTFEVKDLNTTYNVFYNVRNNRNYLYHNLYLTHYLTASDGKIVHPNVDELFSRQGRLDNGLDTDCDKDNFYCFLHYKKRCKSYSNPSLQT